MIEPYYNEDGITIYNADCRDVLPQLEPVDLVLTDPPYGIDYKATQPGAIDYGKVLNDDAPFDPTFLLNYPSVIIWGANNFSSRLPQGGWLVWDKRVSEAADRMMGSPFELGWTNKKTLYKICRLQHGGAKNADAKNGDVANQKRSHPTQKPVRLMKWCIGFAPEPKIVLDPFMGSGTTLRAAKDLGLKAIGIEIERKYCDIAIERLRQQAFSFEAAS